MLNASFQCMDLTHHDFVPVRHSKSRKSPFVSFHHHEMLFSFSERLFSAFLRLQSVSQQSWLSAKGNLSDAIGCSYGA